MRAQLIALLTAIFYASALVSARRGLRYSTPITVTCVSVIVQTVTLWAAVFLTGGIPTVSPIAAILFISVGFTQLGVRLLAYTGVHKIGASRSSALQSISPVILETGKADSHLSLVARTFSCRRCLSYRNESSYQALCLVPLQ